MGFGLIFIGYLLTFLLSLAGGYGCYPALVGCFVLLYAQTKLTEYEQSFKYSFFATIPMSLCALFDVLMSGAELMETTLPGFLGWAETEVAIRYADMIFKLAFHALLLLAVARIAADTGLDRVNRAANRNLVVYVVYFALAAIAAMLPAGLEIAPYIFIAQFVLYLTCAVLNATTLFSCYMHICDEGDQDMKAKPSRFESVNRWREEFDRREEKARRASLEYRAERMAKQQEKLNRKKQKKKR